MKKPKYFFTKDDCEPEFCRSLNYFKEQIEEGLADNYRLVEAKPDYGEDWFYCTKMQDVGLKSEGGCGKECPHYNPRNGKSGRCRFSKHCYTEGNREYEYDGKTLKEIKP